MNNSPVASRILTRADGSKAQALLFAPQPHGEDWFCRIQVDTFEPVNVYGIDSFQALSLALVALVSQLRNIERTCPGRYLHLDSPKLSADLGLDRLLQ